MAPSKSIQTYNPVSTITIDRPINALDTNVKCPVYTRGSVGDKTIVNL